VQRSLTSGPRGWPVGQIPGRPARFYVSLACGFMHMCLHEKGKAKVVEKVSGGQTTWVADRQPLGELPC
jgi:hypothetical protein